MQTVYIQGVAVREIIPVEATQPSVAHWYGAEFAAHCVEAPDDVREGYIYDAETGTFAPPPPPVEPEPTPDYSTLVADVAEVQAAIDAFLAEVEEVGTDG